MNPFYRRRQEWSAYRVYQPPGAQQSEEALHRMLLQLWARTKRGWWYRLTQGQPWLCLELSAVPGRVDHTWVVPRALGAFTRQELAGAYRPGAPEQADGKGTNPQVDKSSSGQHSAGAILRLTRPACFGLAPFRADFAQDLTAALGGLQPGEEVALQLLLIPLRDGEWKPGAHAAFRRAAQLKSDGSMVTDVAARWADDILGPVDDFLGLGRQGHATVRRDVADAVERSMVKEAPAKLRDHAFEVVARIVASASTGARALSLVHAVTAQFAALDDANQVIARRAWAPRRLWRLVQDRWPTGTGDVWTCGELTNLVAVPGPRPDQAGARVLELREPPPAGELTLGYAVHRGQQVPVQITTHALCQHMAILGKTGSGKGVLLLNLCMELARKGHGFTALWPLRRDAYALMAALPEERLQDVVFFEVGHPAHALPLNLLAHDGTEEDRARVERDTMSLAWRLWSDSWGKSMERYLRAAVIGAAAVGGHLGTAERILTDEGARAKAAVQVANESVRRFLQAWDASPAGVDPAVNKLQELLWQPPIAAMVAQPDALPWRDVILGRKIVVGSLNQELMGDLAANLAAGGLVSQLQRAAMSIPPGQRLFHGLLLDEFRTAAGRARDNWEVGFSQLRQFQVGLIPAGQYPAQLPEAVWRAMTGNVGSKIVLREEGEHARTCLELLGAGVTTEDLQALPSLQGIANLLLDGKPVGPFTLYAPEFLQPIRDGFQAAEESMVRHLRPRQDPKTNRAPAALEVD